MITFDCPSCQKSYHVDDRHAGKTSKCKSCNSPMLIPTPQSVHAGHEQAYEDDEPSDDNGFGMRQIDPPAPRTNLRRSGGSPSRSSSSRRGSAPVYPMLTIVAWIARIIGALTVAVGLITLLLGIISAIGMGASGGSTSNPQFSQADAGAAAAITGILSVVLSIMPILSGVFIMAAGELLFAVRDIALNTRRALD